MFIVRDLTPLSHNCLILESKEMQGYIVAALWGNAVCQQCEQTHEMNVEWVQRKWGVSFKEKYSCSGREGKDRRKLDTSEAKSKWTSWNKHIKLNRNGEVKLWSKEMWVCKEEQQKSFSYSGNSFSWTVSSPSVWSGLYRVWRFWCFLDGHRKWSTPPSPGSSEGNTIPLIWSDDVLRSVLVLRNTWGLNRGAEVNIGNKDKM